MGYTIIFETKICKLDNGDIIHFSLDGCNNDDCGRRRNEFTAKYYTAEEWENEIRSWENIGRTHSGFDMKIGSRYVQYADYGKHLRTMTKRAKSFEEYKKERYVYGEVYEGITYYPGDGSFTFYPYNSKEIHDFMDGVLHGKLTGGYRRKFHRTADIDELIEIIKSDNRRIKFYIGKKAKNRLGAY